MTVTTEKPRKLQAMKEKGTEHNKHQNQPDRIECLLSNTTRPVRSSYKIIDRD